MKLSTLTSAMLLILGTHTNAFAADTAPTTPSNLTAKLYAGAGGEIFWNRSSDDRGVHGYEITRNGQSLGVRDAVSYYDASLRANTAYTFTVTAVDSAGQRSATASVTLGGGTTTPATPQSSGALASPSELRASVYSTTSAELFWARAASPGLRYEVLRDGQLITTTNGISHYASGLAAARDYAYQVIAIDSTGKRSAPASIVVRTSGGTSTPTVPANPTTPPVSGGNTQPALQPKDVSIKIYSSTAAELFWTPADGITALAQKNEIRRDGVLIATLQGEALRSYFDNNREPGKRYSYEITAISSQGKASASISDADVVAPQPATPATPSTVDLPANVRAKLDSSFDIINGVAVEKVMATLEKLADRSARGTLGLVRNGTTRTDYNGSLADVYTCPKGGELLDAQGDADNAPYSYAIDARDCAIGSVVISAYAQIDGPFPTGGSVQAVNIEMDDVRDLSTIVSENMFYFPDESNPRFSQWSAFGVSVAKPENSYSGSMSGNGRDQTNVLPDGSFGFTTRGDGIVGPFTGVSTLRTLGPLEFTNGRDNARPTVGRVSIGNAADNLLIDAFNGDPATFTLTVTNSGSAISYTVPFSDTYRFEAPVINGVDIGF